MAKQNDILFSPTEAHEELRENVLKFAKQELDASGKENDEVRNFNKEVFKKLATEIGLLE